jgi:hypothetical protein
VAGDHGQGRTRAGTDPDAVRRLDVLARSRPWAGGRTRDLWVRGDRVRVDEERITVRRIAVRRIAVRRIAVRRIAVRRITVCRIAVR